MNRHTLVGSFLLASAFISSSVLGFLIPAVQPAFADTVIGVGGNAQCPSLNRTLSYGMSGSDVTQLQQYLAADPTVYPEANTSGFFGTLTQNAVQRFQAKYGIVSSGSPTTTGYGLVGAKTRNTINTLCSGGSGGLNFLLKPANFQAAPTANSVALSWSPVTLSVRAVGYDIYENGVQIATTQNTSYLVANLSCGTSIAFAVDAFDSKGDHSSQATLNTSTILCSTGGGPDTQPPTTPQNLATTSVSAIGVAVSWSPSTDNVGVAGYDLYKNGTRIGTTQATSYQFVPVSCGAVYLLGVDAYDAAGNHSAVATLSVTVTCGLLDTQPPSVPVPSVANMTQAKIGITWPPSTDNVGVTGYDTYLNGVLVATLPPLHSYTFNGLSCGVSYTLGVDAYDAAGNHSAIGSVQGSTKSCGGDTQPPSVPTNLAGVPSTRSVALTWNASTDNVGVVGYDIFRNGIKVAISAKPGYRDRGLTAGTSYTYTVDAFDAAGNHSAQSSAIQVTTLSTGDTQPPTVPTGLIVTGITSSTVSLGWTASNDNIGVAGYDIYQGGVLVGTTAATSYTDTGLSAGTSYTYTVDAFDAAGNYSAESSPVSVTTSGGGDTQSPTTPTSFAAGASTATSIPLSWTASTDNVLVTGYTVYTYVNGSAVPITTTTQTNYVATNLTCNTSYQFGVDAFDAAGNHSAIATVTASTAGCGGSGATIVTPKYPAESVIVAVANVTDPQFGADPTGVTDSTAAFQKALNYAASVGGGTVWAPAGTYRFNGPLTIPSTVALHGDWKQPTASDKSVGGTILAIYYTGAQSFINLDGGSGIDGLNFWYPTQTVSNSNPYQFPATVTLDPTQASWRNLSIQNITFVNSYIIFDSRGGGGKGQGLLVDNIYGTALNLGLWLDDSSSVCPRRRGASRGNVLEFFGSAEFAFL